MKPRKMMGLEVPGDERVPVPVRDWRGMQRALWRSKAAWEKAERAAREIIKRCAHTEGCLGATHEEEPCRLDCSDREQRMSALVILNAARMFGPIDARRPADEPYYAPSREYFSEVLGALGAAQAELEALRGGVQQVTLPPPEPPQLEEHP